MFDLADDAVSIRLIQDFWNAGKPVSFTCHGPAALRHVIDPGGSLLVRGKRITGFANSEEAASGPCRSCSRTGKPPRRGVPQDRGLAALQADPRAPDHPTESQLDRPGRRRSAEQLNAS